MRPDTYVGSIVKDTQTLWVIADEVEEIPNENALLSHLDNDNSNGNRVRKTGRKIMQEEEIEFVPGLYKIFDEILVNAADNKQRDPKMSYIDVRIDEDRGCIAIENDGKGIPVKIHKEHNMYIPEMIFGHLLTSSNYNVSMLMTLYVHYCYCLFFLLFFLFILCFSCFLFFFLVFSLFFGFCF